MHPNPVYRAASCAENAGFARDRGFGILAVAAPDGPPLVSHVPFLLNDDASHAELHLVRSNPIARLDLPVPARLAVSGPDAYLSPDWYEIPDQVPTWNYVAVHLTGHLEPMQQETLPGLLDRLSAHFEARLSPKPQWTMAKMLPEPRDRLMRMIAPFRLRIDQIDGTWKLSQNKPDAARLAAAGQIAAHPIGTDTALLSALMHRPPMPQQEN